MDKTHYLAPKSFLSDDHLTTTYKREENYLALNESNRSRTLTYNDHYTLTSRRCNRSKRGFILRKKDRSLRSSPQQIAQALR